MTALKWTYGCDGVTLVRSGAYSIYQRHRNGFKDIVARYTAPDGTREYLYEGGNNGTEAKSICERHFSKQGSKL